jgi:hypothetical protein
MFTYTTKMIEAKPPYQTINDLVQMRKKWSNEQILTELASLEPLPDEFAENEEGFKIDSEWDNEETCEKALNLAYLFVAHCDIAVYRQIELSVPLLLERACYGEVGELLRGIDKAFYHIVNQDLNKLSRYCIAAFSSPRKGTRMWAVRTLFWMRKDNISGVTEVLKLANKDLYWIRISS